MKGALVSENWLWWVKTDFGEWKLILVSENWLWWVKTGFGEWKLALLAYEDGNMFDWTQASFLHCEPNAPYRKYKETAHMPCSNNPIS